MFFVYLVLLAVILIINRSIFGTKIMPTDIFSAIWCIFAGTASLGVLGYYKTEFEVNIMIIVTIVVFNLAFISVFAIRNRGLNCKDDGSEKTLLRSTHMNFYFIVFVNVVCWIISLPYLKESLTIIANEGFEALRRYAFDFSGEESNTVANTNMQLVLIWLIQPVFTATMALSGVVFITKHKHRIPMLVLSLIDAAVYACLLGGRGIILKLVSLVGIAFIVAGGKNPFKYISRNGALITLIGALFAVLVWMTMLRSFSGMSVVENVYAYIAAPFIYLQTLLQEYPLSSTPMLWGSATVGGIVSVVGIVGKIFFGIDFAAPENTIPQITSGYLQIGQGIWFNSMTTMLYPFLRDFGYAGVFIGPAIFAAVVALVYRNFEKNRTLRGMCVLIYLFHTVIFSVQNYTFFKLEACMIIVFILLFTTKFDFKMGKIRIS